MVFSEGTTEKKSPVTPPGIDPGTVRLVAQRLNHYTTPGPRLKIPAASLFALPSHFLNKLSFIFSISSLICLISCSNLSLSSFQFVSCLSSVSRPILYRYIFSSCIVFHILWSKSLIRSGGLSVSLPASTSLSLIPNSSTSLNRFCPPVTLSCPTCRLFPCYVLTFRRRNFLLNFITPCI